MSAPAPDIPRFSARLLASRDAGGGLSLIALGAGEGAFSYGTPGQYTWIELGAQGGYFVLAGTPRSATWELVASPGGGVAEALRTATPGTLVSATHAIGRGFPWARAAGRALVVAVPAKAIGVARPVLLERAAEGEAARTLLLVGARHKADVPLGGELAAFRAAGARVIVCLSQEDAGGELGYARGYVQDVALSELGESALASDSSAKPVVFVAAHTKAEKGVRHKLEPRGVEVHSND